MTTLKTGLNIQVVLLRARSSREGMSFSGNLIKLRQNIDGGGSQSSACWQNKHKYSYEIDVFLTFILS